MQRKITLLMLLLATGIAGLIAQNTAKPASTTKVEVYYFHPNERCEIDQSIEANTRALMQSDFKNQIKQGIIKFAVLNTDDKANAKTVSRFEINAQALYIVKHEGEKEIKTDLTTFAFDFGLTNPQKFKSRLKDEVEKALK